MAENNKIVLTVPSLTTSTAVLALLGVVTAIVTFVWVFTSEAEELRIANQETKFDQMNLREFAKEIAENVKLNTIAINENRVAINENRVAINENTKAIMANGEKIGEISVKIDNIENYIKYLVCKSDDNFSDRDCMEYLGNQ